MEGAAPYAGLLANTSMSDMNNRRKCSRQRYIPIACDFCKKRHSRCDAARPRCSLCTRFNEDCKYETEARKKGRKKSGQGAAVVARSSTTTRDNNVVDSESNGGAGEIVQERVESRLAIDDHKLTGVRSNTTSFLPF